MVVVVPIRRADDGDDAGDNDDGGGQAEVEAELVLGPQHS